MGYTLKRHGKIKEAVEAFKGALLIDPDNLSTKHIIASLTNEKTETAPREYVENLFDDYANKFENSLVKI